MIMFNTKEKDNQNLSVSIVDNVLLEINES